MTRKSELTLSAELSKAILAEDPFERQFDFKLAFVTNYSDLLSGAFAPPETGIDSAIEATSRAGRVLLSAEAGCGKTTVGKRLLLRAAELGKATARIDLRRWTPVVHQSWQAANSSGSRRMDVLLEQVADVRASERAFRAEAENGAFIVVDGLNEVPPAATAELLNVLDAFAARCPWAAVFVCDRIQRRALPSSNWRLLTITSVTDADRPEGPDNALLLDIADNDDANEAQTLLRRLERAGDVADIAVSGLPRAGLDLYARYKEGQGRYFELAALLAIVDSRTVERLLGSGELVRDGSRAYFRHHLFHDALAASAVASDPTNWTDACLRALTFDANSFDAIALALELLKSPTEADEFVMAVYDWNLYAAAYAVGQGRRRGGNLVSEDVEVALLAVLAERRWDPVAPSVERVEDALRVSPHLLASQLLAAPDLPAVVKTVSGYAEQHGLGHSESDWLHFFDGSADFDELIVALGSGPIPGWIASNALRRHRPLEVYVRDELLQLLHASDGTVRWRAAHALGADATTEGSAGLFKILEEDQNGWVRYGAVRALVEIAAENSGLRELIVSGMTDRLDLLEQDQSVFAELQRALELRQPPDGWATAVAPLIEELFLRARTIADQDHWRRVGRRVTESVERARAAA